MYGKYWEFILNKPNKYEDMETIDIKISGIIFHKLDTPVIIKNEKLVET